jgi:D-xylose transport system permease protein
MTAAPSAVEIDPEAIGLGGVGAPVRLFLDDDLRRGRLTALARPILAVPHLLLLTAWSLALAPGVLAATLAGIVTGRVPQGLHEFVGRYLRYSVQVSGYMQLVTEPFPAFGGDPGYPLDVDLPPRVKQSRWRIALRPLLALPAMLLARLLGVIAAFAAAGSWVLALVLGRTLPAFRDTVTYALSYKAQTLAYTGLLTDVYPTLGADVSSRAAPDESIPAPPILDRIRSGDLGSWPVIIALAIVVLAFSQTAQNFFTPGNFTNIITQMAGTCLLAYGIIFVLLIGEIDLSVSFVSGVAGVVVAKAQLPNGAHLPWYVCVFLAILAATAIGAFQGSVVALIGVPSFVVTLAGFEIWQGVIQRTVPGVIVIQDNMINNFSSYFFSAKGGWIIAGIVSAAYVGGMVGSAISGKRHGIALRSPILFALKVVLVPVIALLTVWISNKDRGVPFALLLVVGALLVWTFVAKRTTFGRHVYAVGGNAEAARRAGINVARIRILVFMISGAMSGLGGIVLAARLNSVDLNAGGGTLLIDAIAAAVIGGTSLFGGRGEIRNALIGAALISTVSNGMFILGYTTGVIFMVTGAILLLAVTFDTVARRLQVKTGR